MAIAMAMAIPQCQWRHNCIVTLGSGQEVCFCPSRPDPGRNAREQDGTRTGRDGPHLGIWMGPKHCKTKHMVNLDGTTSDPGWDLDRPRIGPRRGSGWHPPETVTDFWGFLSLSVLQPIKIYTAQFLLRVVFPLRGPGKPPGRKSQKKGGSNFYPLFPANFPIFGGRTDKGNFVIFPISPPSEITRVLRPEDASLCD